MPGIKETYQALKGYTILENIQLLFAILFVGTLALDQKTNSTLLGISLFLLLFTFRWARLLENKTALFVFTATFLVQALALSYSSNAAEGKLVIERHLALFLIPLIYLSCFNLTAVKFNLIIKFFFVSMVVVSLYLLKHSIDQLLSSGASFHDWFVRDNLNHAFSRPIGMHATYLSLYTAVAIFIGFNGFLFDNSWWLKLLFFLSTLVLAITIILLSSRMVISALLFVLLFIYPFYIVKLKHKATLLIAGCAILLAFFFIMRESSFITTRFTEKIRAEVKMTPFLQADSTYNPIYGGEMRADRWYCAAELIREKPLLGYGTGSEKDMLMKKYEKYNLQNAIVNNYDSHNQYLAFAIKAGVPGLIFFVLSVVYAIYLAIKSRSLIYLSFIVLFAIACITENVLESNKGIFFFAFFNTLFATRALLQLKSADDAH
jgi:O-antigen ligase